MQNLKELIELKMTKELENLLFKKALKSKKLKIKDLIYQAELLPEISFKDALIASYIVKYVLTDKNIKKLKKVKYAKIIQSSKKDNVKKTTNKNRRNNKSSLK